MIADTGIRLTLPIVQGKHTSFQVARKSTEKETPNFVSSVPHYESVPHDEMEILYSVSAQETTKSNRIVLGTKKSINSAQFNLVQHFLARYVGAIVS